MKILKKVLLLELLIVFFLFSCQEKAVKKEPVGEISNFKVKTLKVTTQITTDSSTKVDITIPLTGRYNVSFYGKGATGNSVWLEDYIDNKDDRIYNVTGSVELDEFGFGTIDGSPLAKGKHSMMLHIDSLASVDSLVFDLMVEQEETPKSLTQKMDGTEWSLVWSDEFDGTGLPDATKWSNNIGNWGWGNNEPQYYTKGKTKNARQENGTLIIEAHKNDDGNKWTSARLTTQGRVSFKYGRIEYRAKVPAGRGTWAAGWLLGDAYQDELSWPYCGEIDVLECVGFEIDDSTGVGLNHATCHTRAYYFKQENQIGSEIEVDSMDTKFHTYAVEWYPNEIKGYLDGEHYYTYDKTANEQEWPFYTAQNIIINLAIGGGWGGAEGIDESYDSHQYILDYVRVYEKR